MNELSVVIFLICWIGKLFCLKDVKILSCSASENQVNKELRGQSQLRLSPCFCRKTIIALSQLMVNWEIQQGTDGQFVQGINFKRFFAIFFPNCDFKVNLYFLAMAAYFRRILFMNWSGMCTSTTSG